MIKIEELEISGIGPTVRGVRNPMNSHHLSDSDFSFDDGGYRFWVGENDLALMQKLRNAGPDHGKFMRMIQVWVDITAPLYWWKQFDQYKVGVTTDSCSTMHKIHAKEFDISDFSHEHLIEAEQPIYEGEGDRVEPPNAVWLMYRTIQTLNQYRALYLKTKDKTYWWQLIQLLPSSYNQKRTVNLNYEVLHDIYHARKHHKLDEWHDFCDWIEYLPYAKLITGEE